jgi:hypothetical protein
MSATQVGETFTMVYDAASRFCAVRHKEALHHSHEAHHDGQPKTVVSVAGAQPRLAYTTTTLTTAVVSSMLLQSISNVG